MCRLINVYAAILSHHVTLKGSLVYFQYLDKTYVKGHSKWDKNILMRNGSLMKVKSIGVLVLLVRSSGTR